MNELRNTAAVLLAKRASIAGLTATAQGKLGGSPTGLVPHGGALMGPLVQSLLLGGLGWGAGRIAAKFMPRVNAKRLGVVTGLAGAALPWLQPYNAMELATNLNRWKADPARAGLTPLQQPGHFLRSMNQTLQGAEKVSYMIGTPSNLPDGFGIPVAHTIGMIQVDPLLSPIQKAQAINLVQSAQPSGSGIISWPAVSRAAVGAGVGFTAATLFGKALDTVFGGLSTPAQRKLQGAGTIAGILVNTGAIR